MVRLGLTTIVAAALAAAPLGGCIIESDDGDSTITVTNLSDYDIYDLYVAEVGDRDWGPDLLGGGVLERRGDSITIIVECGTYDVLVVDDTETDCILGNLDLCFDDSEWVIDNATLDTCAFNPLTSTRTKVAESPTAAEANSSSLQ
jgi:hypothetical protein